MHVDVHAHVLGEGTMARLQRESATQAPRLVERHGDTAVVSGGDWSYPVFPVGGWDLARRLADMDAAGVDVQAVSVPPFCFGYGLEPALGLAFARIHNDDLAALARAHPTRFVGLATLPLQDPDAAATELRRAVGELGLRGSSLGTHVAGRNLDDPALEPVWAAAEELGAFLFVHPDRPCAAERLARYYLINLLGNPMDTSIAIASLVFGGVLERHPGLTFCFAHGGGFIPYQQGRLLHGWRCRSEPHAALQGSPDDSLSLLYFDTIVHSPAALDYLIGTAGADHVLLGSDYPYDMGTLECARQVRALSIPECDRATILGGLALKLFASSGDETQRHARAR